jgi:uncharacterized protein YjgD (DUF1641 family)
MEAKQLEQQIQELNQKLDLITEYIREEQKRKNAMEELKHDLIKIGNDAFGAAVEELDEVADYFEMDDLLFLLKKVLRNIRNLNRLFDMMESGLAFLDDVKPLGNDAFNSILELLDEFDKKGYFDFMKESFLILDTIIQSFSVDDVRALRENIVLILNTVKNMTQPEMLDTINNALNFFQYLGEGVKEKITLRDIFRELKDPQTRRGMVFAIHLLKNLTQMNANGKNSNTKKEG